jgi:hypothetical protein
LKNKIIYSALFLTTAISCSSFKPYVLTNAFIDPASITPSNYEQINWSYSLFNQYASGLSYGLRMNFSAAGFDQPRALRYQQDAGTFFQFTEWDIITATFAEAQNISSVWRQRINTIFFDRSFDRVSKNPTFYPHLRLDKNPTVASVNLELIIKSKISYNVNIGSIYYSFLPIIVNIDNALTFISFYNKDDQLLQTVLLRTSTGIAPAILSDVYNLSSVITNVNRFDIKIQMVDTPPPTANFSNYYIFEFNLFTQGQEISIPDDTDGSVFGFEFVAVEWWNFLGHLQNFAWWIVNKSPISPLFVWIDTYVITWISGLITFITGVFDL